MKTPFIILILISFLLTGVIGPMPAYGSTLLTTSAQADEFRLPAPGVMVHLSPEFNPPVLKGIKVHPDNPFRLDFILDKGDDSPSNVETQHLASTTQQTQQERLKQEATRLIKYFLASLTIPEKDLWVNLSPYEKDRIVPESFGQTEMGRDLLAQDYLLKQITASLIYPEDEVGKKFWKRIYEEAAKKFGTTSIPVNTFNKVWIVPEKAVVYENAKSGTAYVVESKLKVMLEQDYLSLEKHNGVLSQQIHAKNTNQLGSQIVREVVIPELIKEVNENKNFSQLRQVYNSLILATWYKKKIKDSILSQVYADKNKVKGVNIDDPQEREKIYQQYLKAFKKGVYNKIKEEQDPISQGSIPRKYFSGGVLMRPKIDFATVAQAKESLSHLKDRAMRVESVLGLLDSVEKNQVRDVAQKVRPVPSNLLNVIRLNSSFRSISQENVGTFQLDMAMINLNHTIEIFTKERLNEHVNEPPLYLNLEIRHFIVEFLTKNNDENTQRILQYLFGSEVQVSEIRGIVMTAFQEGEYYVVFKGDLTLIDGSVRSFVLMTPTRQGESNRLIAQDFSNLEKYHAQYPDIFPKPLVFDGVPINNGKSVDDKFNIITTEWLGDYVELPDDYHGNGRLLINSTNREGFIKHLNLVDSHRRHLL